MKIVELKFQTNIKCEKNWLKWLKQKLIIILNCQYGLKNIALRKEGVEVKINAVLR